ncbi:DUF58 domain-containing protein [Falcatimonas sp. MSJ-15]|uniref:DUF58 domain-containing protein n=1 Tax=Falcatimonas sp. MSJ-15 TaxID=2841515 RepID=UPI001C10577D|nr:DUF58 domain-containing protein [Falcatimonas sp. MSJ-15]MBU5469177.1 DUF58 domain-containing protein [Falcatimonas sp. MSJ-15]
MIKTLLILLGILVIYFLQKHLYSKHWKSGLSTSLAFDMPSCVEGDTVTFTQTVTNNKLLPLPLLELKFHASKYLNFNEMDDINESDLEYIDNVYSLLFFQKVKRKLNVRCTKRGFYHIDKVDLVSSDLLMGHTQTVQASSDASILVYPLPIDVHQILIPYNMVMGDILSKRYSTTDPFEFRGIREYDINDTMKSINWKQSARTGSLKVNLHDYTNSQKVHILLNLESESIWDYTRLKEESIRIACSLCTMFISEGIQTALTSNGRDIAAEQNITIPFGCGQSHIDTISAELALCDYNGNLTSFCDIIKDIQMADASNNDAPFYILISENRNKTLQDAFSTIIENDDYLYIIPLHPEVSDRNVTVNYNNILEWEVPYAN